MNNSHSHQSDDQDHHEGPRGFNIVLIAFLAIIGFFLLMEHRAHLVGILPWLILALCPLMHLFMHGGHGGHGGHGNANKED